MNKFLFIVLGAFIFLQHTNVTHLEHSLELYQQVVESQNVFISDMVQHIGYMNRYKIPYEYLQITLKECEAQGVDPDFIIRLMYVESQYNRFAKSTKRAYGLMQLQYPTAKEIDPSLESHWQLFDPETNIRIGVAHFKALLEYYEQNYQLAAIAYNRGIGRLDSELAEGGLIDWYYVKIESVEVVQ